ncbi:MAG: lipopolysaccharide biosynthesis protein [Deltaproteobacteria bacterium]|nr:lipopolysaccharide biosynthesis protein [Deltaproteobacteria bacterium]
MNSTNPNNLPPEYYDEDEINLLDLLLVLLKRKWLIFWVTFLAIVLSLVISLRLPEKFTATARILPPQESNSGMSSLLSQAGGAFGGLAASIVGGKTSADLYVGIMESRTIADILIKKFNLKKLWEMDLMAPVYSNLADLTSISVDKTTRIISVSVEDINPVMAADIANAYIAELDNVNRTVNVTAAQRKRAFLEKRLEKAKDDLIEAEAELQGFQEKYKLVSINDQARISMEGAAKIKGEIIVAQTELEVLKQFGTERQNEAIMLKSKIDELQKQLARIESGNPSKDKDNFYIPFTELPNLGMKLARLMRETKIQEEVFGLLTSQYELAKIEEAKDMNTIQILDEAVPPDRKSGPKRRLIVILSTLVAFFLAVFLAFFMEFIQRIKTEDQERYQMMVDYLKFRKPK